MHGDDVFDQHISFGSSGCDHQSPGFDLIRNDTVVAAVQALYTADANSISANATNTRSHLIEKVGHVDHMRLFGGINQRGIAFGEHCGQHDIDGCTD